MLVTRKSIWSGIERSIELPITEEQMSKWEKGMHAQHAFSNLDASQREFIITGVTAEEWNEMFQDEADDV